MAVKLKIEKAPTGIEGFDQATRGGLPRQRTTVVMGGAGSGKTVFALQSLVNGARRFDEPGILVAFEENAADIRANAASFGWDLPALEDEHLFLLNARLPLDTVQAGDFDLSGLLAGLTAKVAGMDARRIVFDGIDVLLFLLDDPLAERREIYRLHNWLRAQQLTGIITAKRLGGTGALQERYSFLDFMADCVVLLEHEVQQLHTMRTLRVTKYRGSDFVESKTPFVITSVGLEVANTDPLGRPEAISGQRVSTGVPALDRMLEGGYYRATNVLITGAPGTAKSTLAGAFVEAACARGERALFVSFDENANEIVRNLASVDIQLAPYVDAGLLLLHSTYTGARSAESHFLRIQQMITDHQPACLVIDPLTAVLKVGGHFEAASMAQRLLFMTKNWGVTSVVTSLLEKVNPAEISTDLEISTLADTWIQLSYQDRGGERNRALSIIKSRGTAHSNQVRELILSDDGISLADVYTAGGEVLMGTLRWEKEAEAVREREQQQRAAELRRRELELASAETRARMKMLERQLEAQQAEIAYITADRDAAEQEREERKEKIKKMRRGGSDGEQDGG